MVSILLTSPLLMVALAESSPANLAGVEGLPETSTCNNVSKGQIRQQNPTHNKCRSLTPNDVVTASLCLNPQSEAQYNKH